MIELELLPIMVVSVRVFPTDHTAHARRLLKSVERRGSVVAEYLLPQNINEEAPVKSAGASHYHKPCQLAYVLD